MTHGSLFSGIGGFDLAAEWMGWDNKFHCEWNPFGQTILKHYWPNAISYEDITKTDFTVHRGNIDILTGGFPCQPYSSAGKRLGKEDERHLWPHMLRAISEIQPSWVVGENVRGLVNWNDGLVFHEVQSDLEAQGYEVQPFLIPAAGINAPHQRYRIWFIAYNATNTYSRNSKRIGDEGRWDSTRFGCNGEIRNVTNTSSRGMERHRGECKDWEFQANESNKNNSKRKSIMDWEKFPTVSPICNGDDGLSYGLDTITFSKWRKESIKAGGNAIVPQVALNIFKAINEYERINCITNNSTGNKNPGI